MRGSRRILLLMGWGKSPDWREGRDPLEGGPEMGWVGG